MAKKAKRKLNVSVMPFGKAVRVREIVGEYLASHKYERLSTQTKRAYQNALGLFDRLVLGNNQDFFEHYVHKVDYEMVDYIHRVLAFTNSGSSIKVYFSVLSNVWQYALRRSKVPYNPWLKNEVRVNNERDVVWTPEQITIAVDEAIRQKYNVLALYLLLMYETGVRPWIDLRNLTWDNVRQHEDGSYILDFVISKTNVHIMLPLSDRARSALSNMPRTNNFIFCDAAGRHLTRIAMLQQLNKVKLATGLSKQLQFRDIRRSALTEMVEAGATRDEMRSVAGWKSDRHVPRYARIRYGAAKNGLEKRWRNQSVNT